MSKDQDDARDLAFRGVVDAIARAHGYRNSLDLGTHERDLMRDAFHSGYRVARLTADTPPIEPETFAGAERPKDDAPKRKRATKRGGGGTPRDTPTR